MGALLVEVFASAAQTDELEKTIVANMQLNWIIPFDRLRDVTIR